MGAHIYWSNNFIKRRKHGPRGRHEQDAWDEDVEAQAEDTAKDLKQEATADNKEPALEETSNEQHAGDEHTRNEDAGK